MAFPSSDSYSAPSGGTIRGGRFGVVAAVTALLNKYRYQSKQLFQTARSDYEPTHNVGGNDLSNEGFGPNYNYVDSAGGWSWDHPGGDWLDSTQTRWGSAAWFTINANSATSPATYSANCLTSLQFIQTNNRWCAFYVKCPAIVRDIASPFHLTSAKPVITGTYVSGAAFTLACKIVGAIDNSSAYPNTTAPSIRIPAFIEFEKPTAAVASASLSLTVTYHPAGGTPTISFYVVDPTVNTAPTVLGIAQTGALDAGLVGHANIIGVHRYVDGSTLSQFTHAGPPISSESSFDPAIYGTGPTNLSKFPHAGLGKFINPPASGWSMVPSTYVGESFTPLAPGMGALKVDMNVIPTMGENFFPNSYNGTSGASSQIFMPEPQYGLLGRIFVRHYIMIGTPNGTPYRMPISRRYQQRQTSTSELIWADAGGKWGITPSHSTTDGGNSGSSGGGYGWQMRNRWHDCTADETGPDVEGWTVGTHTYDFQGNNPVGYRYGITDSNKDSSFSQQGGLGGNFVAGRWYCVEMELKLNTVSLTAPGYTPDGELRFWIDGRLALERTGMVFRSLPLMSDSGMVYNGIYLRPCRELGVASLWFNWYHGGMTQNTIPRTTFITGLAWGTAYIGPMQMPGVTLPAWVPATNTLANLPEVNSFESINPGTGPANSWSYWEDGSPVGNNKWASVIDAFSGGVYNPYFSPSGGNKGSMIYHGSGHGDGLWGGIVAFDLSSLTYSIVMPGTLNAHPHDPVNCEFADGQPLANHSYDNLVIIGPESGYPKGALMLPVIMAAGQISYNSTSVHLYDFARPELKWVRLASHNPSVAFDPGGAACYDPDLRRVWWVCNSHQLGYQQYFDLATNTHVKVTLSYAASLQVSSPNSRMLQYDSDRKLLLMADTDNADTVRKISYFSTLTPSAGWTQATLSAQFPVPTSGRGFSLQKVPDGSYLCYARADQTKLFRLDIPAVLTDTWTVTPITYSGVTVAAAGNTGKRWSYVPPLQSIVFKATAATPHQIYKV